MKLKFNGLFDLKYQTRLSVAECFSRILSEPHVFESTVYSQSMVIYAGEKAKERNYDCYPISQTELHVTFKGGQYTKFRRTHYVVEFIPENDLTIVFLRCQGEFFGLLPTTPTTEIDCLIREKIQGERI